MTPEKVIRDGKVAVLISPGFGAGWSTWADNEVKQMALFDRRFVYAKEAGVKDIDSLVKEVIGNKYMYTGGWEDVMIEWLPVGTAFTVEEYDGFESLRSVEDLTYKA